MGKATPNNHFGGTPTWENELGGTPMEILYLNENGYPLTPNKIKKTQTALIIYAVKKDSDSAFVGGTMPMFNNNEHLLYQHDDGEYLVLTTSTDGDETTISVDGADLSYARIMVVESNIELVIPH